MMQECWSREMEKHSENLAVYGEKNERTFSVENQYIL